MTPILSAVYDELVARAGSGEFREEADHWVRGFLQRTGTFAADHPSSPLRLAAAWEDALCRGGLAQRLNDQLHDPAERDLAGLILRAHAGLFAFEIAGPHRILHDVLTGACFVLVSRDNVAREVQGDNLGGLCQGRVVAAADGCALLPGVIFHSAEATPAIEAVIDAAFERGIDLDKLWEGLLRMDFTLQTMARVRPPFAYRIESLETHEPPSRTPWRKSSSKTGPGGSR